MTNTNTTNQASPSTKKPYKKSPSLLSSTIPQAARNLPPTEQDILETYALFDDFCVPRPTNMPEFPTYSSLERYRTAYIKKCLSSLNYTHKAFRKERAIETYAPMPVGFIKRKE